MKFAKLVKEAAPKKIGGKFNTPATPAAQPQPTEDSDKIEQQAEPMVNALNKSADEFELEDFGGGIGDVEQFESTDLPTFNYKSLALYLNFAYSSKQPLLIYGDPGIGKSEVVKGFAEQTGESEGREYVSWNEASNEKKLELMKNPGKYFVLIDVRANKLEPSDFVGIPDIASQAGYLETKQFKWVYFMSLPEAAGILFLDELNQASPQVLKALYEVVNDRSVGGTSIADGFLIVGAGNIGQEFEDPIPQALTNRFTAGVLIADPEGWLEWAEQSGIDKRIIAFVKSHPGENFYAKPKNPDDPFPTPRQMTKLSKQLKNLYRHYGKLATQGKIAEVSIYKAIADIAAGLCGVYWARKFVTFLKHIRSFDFSRIIKDVKNLNKESKDKLHALVVFVVSKLRLATSNVIKSGGQLTPNDVEILEGIAKISVNLNKEWALILWNQIKRELPKPNLEQTVKFMSLGDYDPATKQEMKTKVLPGFKTILAEN